MNNIKKMKKTLALLLSVSLFGVAGIAHAAPAVYHMNVSPDLGSDYVQDINAPDDNDNCQLFGIDSSTHTPRLLTPGLGLGCGSGGSVFNITAVPITGIDGLAESLSIIRSVAATSTTGVAFATSSIATINGQITSINVTLNAINSALTNTISGASTTMLASTNTAGLISAADKTKIDSLSTTTVGVSYEGTTKRNGSFPIFKTVTVASGVGVVNLTTDSLSTGTALCTNGVIQDSVSVTFNDSTASFQQSWAFSNSNKTITVTANKFTTANILSGILGQAAANGSVAKVTVWCY